MRRPPLRLTDEEVDEAISALDRSLVGRLGDPVAWRALNKMQDVMGYPRTEAPSGDQA